MSKTFSVKKIFITFITLTLLVCTPKLAALSVITHDSLKLDDSSTRTDENYNFPTEIIVAPIFQPDNDLDVSETDWFKGVYYYTIEKLGFSDIPFHYAVSSSGLVFQGNKGGDERKVSIKGISDSAIVIAYLSDSNANTFNARSRDSLKELIKDICNRNSIKPEKTSATGVTFVKDTEANTVYLESTPLYGLWDFDLSDILEEIAPEYSPVTKTYSVELSSVSTTTDAVDPGTEQTVSIKLKNIGSYGMYGGTDSSIIASSTKPGTSAFFVNNSWITTTQVELLGEEQSLMPGTEGSFDFKIKAPLYVGEYSEAFELKTGSGTSLTTNAFEIKLNIKRTDKQIVEIDTGPYEFVYLRSSPSQGDNVIRNGVTGERFFLLENNFDTGWAHIDLGNGESAWLANWYIKYL